MNDSLQLPLKMFALWNAPAGNSAHFHAELIRSLIDASNHCILLGTNYLPVSPSLKYPYGMEKVKNCVVLIPAVLFVYCGFDLLH